MRLMIFNREEKYVGVLKHLESAYHTEEINGINILEIKTKEHVEKGYRLIYQDIYGYWQEFIVKGVVESKDQNGTGVDVYAEHAIYETIGDFVEDKRPYDVPANTALEDALATTRWQVGIVDDLGKHSTNFYRISAKDALQRVAENWKGELRYRVEVSGSRIINRYVDCLERLGTKTNKRFTYTKNLHGVKREFKREDVVTALYGFGKGEEIEGEDGDPTGGYGRRITFKEVNDGKAYVENTDALAIWGRNNQNGSKTHVFGQVVFDDCEDPEELKELTLEKLEELSKPQITYEGSVGLLGYVGLGDTVAVIDKDFIVDLRLSSRVVWIKRDLLNPKNNEIVLGNYKDFFTDRLSEAEDHINNFRDKQGVWDRSSIIDSEGTINTQYLNGVIDILKNQILSTQSGWYTDDNGNIVFEKSDGMSAMMLTGSGFMIANTKDGNGDWVWRTFGTGDGFVADEIIAGILKGGKVKFDLTNGTFLIGESIDNYKLLYDGNNLTINADDGIVIDSRNRLYQSQTNIPFDLNSGNGEVQLIRSNYNPYYKVTSDANIDLSASFPKVQFAEEFDDLEEVTTSLDIMVEEFATIILEGKEYELRPFKWTRIYVTKELGENKNTHYRVRNVYSKRITRDKNYTTKLIDKLTADTKVLYYKNLQVQKGNIPDSHQLTPEEIEEITVRYGTQIKQLADSISLMATRGELMALLQLEADRVDIRFSEGNFPVKGKNYSFTIDEFSIGGTSGDVAKHDEKGSTYLHADGSYTDISALGLLRYDAGIGREYHHMTKVIKFSTGGDGQAPAVRWIPLGPEFNDKEWSVALSISDSMQATSIEATLHRIVLTQGHDSNNNVLQPRYRNGQWEYPVTGYTTYYNHKTDSRRYSDLAGIMIITA